MLPLKMVTGGTKETDLAEAKEGVCVRSLSSGQCYVEREYFAGYSRRHYVTIADSTELVVPSLHFTVNSNHLLLTTKNLQQPIKMVKVGTYLINRIKMPSMTREILKTS